MRLLEYQGKELFRRYGIAIPRGRLIEEKREIGRIFRDLDRGRGVVLKSQVLTGKRGQNGGILFAETPGRCAFLYDELINLTISGQPVRKILMEERIEGDREFYLGITVDAEARGPLVMISPCGGGRLEDQARLRPDSLVRIPIDINYGLLDYQAREALFRLFLPQGLIPSLTERMRQLYRLFRETDAVTAEINPLIYASGRGFVALDARVEIDDSALYRQTDILEMKSCHEPQIENVLRDDYRLEYVELDGNIGVISGGAGLTMAAMDCLALAGGRPACFLDCSANVSATGYEMALRTLNTRKAVDCILVNFFGGITRMDRVGQFILEALERIGGLDKPLIIRLEGTDAPKGRAIIGEAGLAQCDTFEEAIETVLALAGKDR